MTRPITFDGRLVPSLLAEDGAATRAFYERLGFQVTGVYPEGRGDPSWFEVSRDGVVIWFHVEPPVGMPTAPALSGTLYLFPDDVEALAQEWGDDVEFLWGPEVMDYGLLEFGLRDPNGYVLAFAQPA